MNNLRLIHETNVGDAYTQVNMLKDNTRQDPRRSLQMYIQQKILLQIMTAVCFLVLLSPYFA
jgi:hypothetical protein